MERKKVTVCPKCGSRDIDFHQRGSRGDHMECRACGHVGKFSEEFVDEDGDDIWP
ncbi:MAG: hypothetical protein R6U32_05490 [Candidatus Woesearchaeota archaeon]